TPVDLLPDGRFFFDAMRFSSQNHASDAGRRDRVLSLPFGSRSRAGVILFGPLPTARSGPESAPVRQSEHPTLE
ncbi:MAG TPA: hypothetical protein VGN75_16500, partial [Kaistia sp.]|nr:hypothetical protein [Kaistia sp.]